MPSKPDLNRLRLSALWLASCLLLLGCDRPAPVAQTQFPVFGTQVTLTAVAVSPEHAHPVFQAVEQRFHQLHRDWHAWAPKGQLYQINQAIAQGQSIQVPNTFKTFIEKTQQLHRASHRLFDPGIGQLIALWGFHQEDWHGPPPSQAALAAWLRQRPSIEDITFEGQRLSSRNTQVQLDFGGNAKGLALDQAAQIFQAAGIDNAIINIGGDLRILGQKNPDKHQAWSIALQSPKPPHAPMAHLQLQGDESIVTSGTYQRNYQWQGQRIHHILDPNTARPTDYFTSVTVVHADATTADTAATALMVAGPSQWAAVAQSMGITQAFLLSPEGQCFLTPGLEKRLTLAADTCQTLAVTQIPSE